MGEERGDVVRAPALERQIDQRLALLSERPAGAGVEHGGNLVVVHDIGRPLVQSSTTSSFISR